MPEKTDYELKQEELRRLRLQRYEQASQRSMRRIEKRVIWRGVRLLFLLMVLLIFAGLNALKPDSDSNTENTPWSPTVEKSYSALFGLPTKTPAPIKPGNNPGYVYLLQEKDTPRYKIIAVQNLEQYRQTVNTFAKMRIDGKFANLAGN